MRESPLFGSPCGRDHNQAKGEVYPGNLPRKHAYGGFSATLRNRMTHGAELRVAGAAPVGLTLGGYEGFSIWARRGLVAAFGAAPRVFLAAAVLAGIGLALHARAEVSPGRNRCQHVAERRRTGGCAQRRRSRGASAGRSCRRRGQLHPASGRHPPRTIRRQALPWRPPAKTFPTRPTDSETADAPPREARGSQARGDRRARRSGERAQAA